MREDYLKLNRTQHYVRASGEERKSILEMLKEKGFTANNNNCTEEMILESVFPIGIDLTDKSIFLVGGASMAAIAASKDLLLSPEEFYRVLEKEKNSL